MTSPPNQGPNDESLPLPGATKLFERWFQGQGTTLEEVLARAQELAPEQCVLLLLADMAQRWGRGEPVLAADYLEQYPKLRSDGEALRDIVLGECGCRGNSGTAPVPVGYPEQYPVAAEDLRRLQREYEAEQRLPLAKPTGAFEGARSVEGLSVRPDPKVEGYEILNVLGQGGMSVVYLARNKNMDRLEVLKVIHQQLPDRSDAAQRFRREIRFAAKLNHLNIVRAYSVPEADGLLVYAMEYVKGEDLAKVVNRNGKLPVANACAYAHQAALGLQHAHEQGMVHRDIKPGNLILDYDDEKHVVKILDFGLARLALERSLPEAAQPTLLTDSDTAAEALTQLGTVMGTPDYIAPEQINDARAADVRADVYSLGCTLYCLLAGQPPFPEGTTQQKFDAHRNQPPRPLPELRKEVSQDLWAVVAKMLAKTPADRYQEPVEVAQALAPFAEATSIEDTTPLVEGQKSAAAGRDRTPDAKRPKKLLLVSLVGALLLVGAIVLYAAGVFPVKGPDTAGDPIANGQKVAGPDNAGDLVANKKVAGIDLVYIPGQSEGEFFWMGSEDDDKDASPDEKPRHKVRISNPFYLGKCKVTVGQFKSFVEDTGHQTKAEKFGHKWTWKTPGDRDKGFDQTPEHPVVCVSWDDADAFCKWLTKKTGEQVRLPREAEWEYSCRAGTTTRFYFGDNKADLGHCAWYTVSTENEGTKPCGLKGRNSFGLCDMHGLAWEWCADGKRSYPNPPKAQPEIDPVGPTDAVTSRVIRGGSWGSRWELCRAATRGDAEWNQPDCIGFRVLVTP